METRILNDLVVQGSFVMADNRSTFPENPAIGTFVVKDECLFGYIKIGGMETWYPFASKTNSYIHSQGLPSLTWTIQHNLGTTDVWTQIKDSQGRIVQAQVTPTDENTLTVTFTSATAGTAVVVAPDSIDVPTVKASVLSVANDYVIIDSSGVRIDGSYALTSGNIEQYAQAAVASEAAARQAADTTLQSNIDAEASTREGADAILAAAINTKVTANTAISAGTGTKITYDSKGLVTSSTSLSATDIPDLSWNKITSGKPTTLAGYGITDAQPLDADLTAIAGLAGTSGLLKKTAADTWSLDTNSYLTGNQSITVSGDATGSGTTSITLTLANSGVTAGTYKSVTVDAKGRVTAGTNPTTLAGYGITDAVSSSSLGVANGVATLDSSGLIPSSQLPSYVDDILEYTNLAAFPASGETGKIYVALDTNKAYRWSGSTYVYITSGAVDSVAGKTGVVTLDKADVGLSNVDNTADANKPVSTAQQAALDLKANLASPALTGTPTAPTAAAETNTTQIATTAFVTSAVSGKANTSHTHVIDDVTGLQTALDGKQAADDDLTAIAGLSGTSGLLKKTAANTWSLDTATYLTSNQSISISGDASGSGSTSISLTLANSGVISGTYNNSATAITPITVDAKGRITSTGTAVTITPAWSSITNKPTTLAGFGITDAVQATGTMSLTDALVSTAVLITSATTANQVVDSFAVATHRAAKYTVQATSGSSFQVVEVLMIHDGTSVFMTEYGNVATGSNLITLDGDISSGNARLLVTPANASTTIKVVRTAINV